MEEFQRQIEAAAKIKSESQKARRRVFERSPEFVKSGFFYWTKYQSVRNQSFQPQFFLADLIKREANDIYNAGDYQEALKLYQEAYSIFSFITNNNPNWRNIGIFDENLAYHKFSPEKEVEKENLKLFNIKTLLNMGTCYLKLANPTQTQFACEEVLKLDPINKKAFYLRAQSRLMTNDLKETHYEEAIKDLEEGLRWNPECPELKQSFLKTKGEFVKFKRAAKKLEGFLLKEGNKEKCLEQKKEEKEERAEKERFEKKEEKKEMEMKKKEMNGGTGDKQTRKLEKNELKDIFDKMELSQKDREEIEKILSEKEKKRVVDHKEPKLSIRNNLLIVLFIVLFVSVTFIFELILK